MPDTSDRRVVAMKPARRQPSDEQQRELWLALRRLLMAEDQVRRSRRAVVKLIEDVYQVSE